MVFLLEQPEKAKAVLNTSCDLKGSAAPWAQLQWAPVINEGSLSHPQSAGWAHWEKRFLFYLHSWRVQEVSELETARIPLSAYHCHFCPILSLHIIIIFVPSVPRVWDLQKVMAYSLTFLNILREGIKTRCFPYIIFFSTMPHLAGALK